MQIPYLLLQSELLLINLHKIILDKRLHIKILLMSGHRVGGFGDWRWVLGDGGLTEWLLGFGDLRQRLGLGSGFLGGCCAVFGGAALFYFLQASLPVFLE